MLMGIKLQAKPTEVQKRILSQWMGCARFIWNGKCEEERYYTRFARKYYPLDTYAPVDQKYSQFKNKELSPWLYEVPSQVLRNSATNWYDTYVDFMQGKCGKPKIKRKSDYGSVHLTRELFRFERCADGVTRLRLGTKHRTIGYLKIKNHRKYKGPNSIYIKKRNGEYWVAFCYDDDVTELYDEKQHLSYLKTCSQDYLYKHIVGIDRGIAIPVQCGAISFDFTKQQKRNKLKAEVRLKRYQRKMARQQAGSNKRYKTKNKLSTCHQKMANIRNDFCHKTSHAIISNPDNKVIILEDLKTRNLTKKPKAKQDSNGKWAQNGARAKAGLNKSILDKGWHIFESYTKYKAARAGKAWFKINPNYTSQECANCSHTHPDNRKSQSDFVCDCCGHIDNADRNAAMVIKKRAIKLILHSGTELSNRGVLHLDTGRGAINKSGLTNVSTAHGSEASKKKGTVVIAKAVAA